MFIFSAFSADTLFIVCFLHLPAHVAIQTHIGFFQCKLLVLQTPFTPLFNMLYISQLFLIKDCNMVGIFRTMTSTYYYFKVQSPYISTIYLGRQKSLCIKLINFIIFDVSIKTFKKVTYMYTCYNLYSALLPPDIVITLFSLRQIVLICICDHCQLIYLCFLFVDTVDGATY